LQITRESFLKSSPAAINNKHNVILHFSNTILISFLILVFYVSGHKLNNKGISGHWYTVSRVYFVLFHHHLLHGIILCFVCFLYLLSTYTLLLIRIISILRFFITGIRNVA
jgi:hypothetical protein